MVKGKSFRIYHHNLQQLTVKIFRVKIDIASEVIKDNIYIHLEMRLNLNLATLEPLDME